MQFRTEVFLDKCEKSIDHQSKLILLGSCFSQHIGSRLIRSKVSTLVNPFGTIFHPEPIFHLLQRAMLGQYFDEADCVSVEGGYALMEVHSSFQAASAAEVVMKANQYLEMLQSSLTSADFLFLTFGTSIGHSFKGNTQLVANCHKLPNHFFDIIQRPVEHMYGYAAPIVDKLQLQYPNLNICYTVSPVRHTRQGMLENSRSKANLVELSHRLMDRSKDRGFYFPAYEIFMDDLRDYRWYEADLIHPTSHAVEYVWELFSKYFFSDQTVELLQEIAKIIAATAHEIQKPGSETANKFCRAQLQKIELLESRYSFLDFQSERTHFQRFLTDKA